MFHIDRTHLGKLNQMWGSGIYIRSTVDQKCYTLLCRDQWRKWWPLYTFDSSNDYLSAYQNCSGTSGRYKCISLSFLYHLHSDYNRRIFLSSDRIHRRFGSLYYFCCIHNFQSVLIISILLQFSIHYIFFAKQIYLYILFTSKSIYCSFYHFTRCIIPAHGVQCYHRNFWHIDSS